MKSIAQVAIVLTADASKFSKEVSKALNKGRREFNAWGKTVGIAGAAAAAGIAAVVAKTAQAGDRLAKVADQLGVSTEALGAYRFAAEQGGVSSEVFDKSLQKMVRSLGEAQMGVGEAKDALASLRLDPEQLAGLGAEEAFLRIAEGISQVEDRTLQAAIAADIFGRSGVELLNTLDGGRAGLEAFRERAEALGLTLSRETAASMEMMNDSLNEASKLSQGAANSLTAELAPAVTSVVTTFTNAVVAGGGFSKMFEGLGDKVIGVVGFLADAKAGVQGFGKIMQAVMTGTIGIVGKLVEAVGFIPQKILEAAAGATRGIEGMVNGLIGGVEGAVNFALKAMASLVEKAMNGMVTAYNSTVAKLPGFDPVSGSFSASAQEVSFGRVNFEPAASGLDSAAGAVAGARGFAGDTSDAAFQASGEFFNEAIEVGSGGGERPSERIKREYEDAKSEAKKAATDIQKNTSSTLSTLEALGTGSVAASAASAAAASEGARMAGEASSAATLVASEQSVAAADEIGASWESAGDGIAGAIVDFARDGENAFDSLKNRAINAALQMAEQWIASLFQVQSAQAATAAAGAAGGGGGGGGSTTAAILGAVSTFAGFFANGGTVRPGQTAVTGEAGPEFLEVTSSGVKVTPMAKVPKSSGTPISGGAAVSSGGEGGGITQNFFFEGADVAAQVQSLLPNITEAAREGLAEAYNLGGGFRKSLAI